MCGHLLTPVTITIHHQTIGTTKHVSKSLSTCSHHTYVYLKFNRGSISSSFLILSFPWILAIVSIVKSLRQTTFNDCWLMVSTPQKNIKVSWDDYSQLNGQIKVMFQPPPTRLWSRPTSKVYQVNRVNRHVGSCLHALHVAVGSPMDVAGFIPSFVPCLSTFNWVNHSNSPPEIRLSWGWFLLLSMTIVRSQWGRYNLSISIHLRFCNPSPW